MLSRGTHAQMELDGRSPPLRTGYAPSDWAVATWSNRPTQNWNEEGALLHTPADAESSWNTRGPLSH